MVGVATASVTVWATSAGWVLSPLTAKQNTTEPMTNTAAIPDIIIVFFFMAKSPISMINLLSWSLTIEDTISI